MPLKYNGQTNLYRDIKVHRRVISICILTGLLEKLFTLSSDGKLFHCWMGTKHFILVRSKGFEINHKAEMTYNIFISCGNISFTNIVNHLLLGKIPRPQSAFQK